MIAVLAGIAGISFGLLWLWLEHPSHREGGFRLVPILMGGTALLFGIYALWTGWSDALSAAREIIHGR